MSGADDRNQVLSRARAKRGRPRSWPGSYSGRSRTELESWPHAQINCSDSRFPAVRSQRGVRQHRQNVPKLAPVGGLRVLDSSTSSLRCIGASSSKTSSDGGHYAISQGLPLRAYISAGRRRKIPGDGLHPFEAIRTTRAGNLGSCARRRANLQLGFAEVRGSEHEDGGLVTSNSISLRNTKDAEVVLIKGLDKGAQKEPSHVADTAEPEREPFGALEYRVSRPPHGAIDAG